MKEQIIEFKTAKLAKEKGFTRTSLTGIYDGYSSDGFFGSVIQSDRHYDISAPTQSLLQKWLREEKDININITYHGSFYCGKILCDVFIESESNGETYEQALEQGLIEALKLI